MITARNLSYLGALALILTTLIVEKATADVHNFDCIERPSPSVSIGRVPVKVVGLDPQVSSPIGGFLKLHFTNSDSDSKWRSPTGGFSFSAGPYDPKSKRLYIWGYFANGWIEVRYMAGTWLFGQSGPIQPNLYYPADDIEDVEVIERSEVLDMLFYSGFTSPHWLTGSQTYNVYQIFGEDMSRIKELEPQKLHYLGDDLANRMAVFAPVGSRWTQNPDVLVWYDGKRIIQPTSGAVIPNHWC